ncbi:hypothetical protein EON64_00525, partial [archaeon]
MSIASLPAELWREVLVSFVGQNDGAAFDSGLTHRGLRNSHYLPQAATVAIIQAHDHYLNRLKDQDLLPRGKITKFLRCTLRGVSLPVINLPKQSEVKYGDLDKINWFLSCLPSSVSCLVVRSDVACSVGLLMMLRRFCSAPGRRVHCIHLPHVPSDIPPSLLHGLLAHTELRGLQCALPAGVMVTRPSLLHTLHLPESPLQCGDLLPLLAGCRSTLRSLDLRGSSELTECASLFALTELPALTQLSLPCSLLSPACLALPRWPPLSS